VHGGGPAAGGALAFGLPGNPVSAIVTFLLFARPAVRALAGEDPGRDRTTAVLDDAYEKGPGRTHAVRVKLALGEDGWHARLTKGAQGSHVLTSMLGADALAVIPAEMNSVAPGERVQVELLPRA
jgi:molybdopterin molybdotransferase